MSDVELPNYPYDLEELKIIDRLLEKIPKYRKRIAVLRKEIDELARHVSDKGAFSNIVEIESLVCKAFYLDMENRPFNTTDAHTISRLKAEIAWHGTIKNRNIPCEICGENRTIDKCHIIPAKFGGLKMDENLLYLCPTHHRLFDRFMLSKHEWAIIDWDRKSEASKKYALKVIFDAQKKFWAKVESGENEKIALYDINEKPFIEYIANEIGKLFAPGKMIKRASIYMMLNKNIREASKKVLAGLIENKVIIQIKERGCNMLLLASPKFEVTPDIVLRIWQCIG